MFETISFDITGMNMAKNVENFYTPFLKFRRASLPSGTMHNPTRQDVLRHREAVPISVHTIYCRMPFLDGNIVRALKRRHIKIRIYIEKTLNRRLNRGK